MDIKRERNERIYSFGHLVYYTCTVTHALPEAALGYIIDQAKCEAVILPKAAERQMGVKCYLL